MEITVDSKKILSLVQQIFESSGLTAEDAHTVSENLVQAEMRGIRSHGLVQVQNYSRLMCGKVINPDAKIALLAESEGTLVFDANHAPGAVAGKYAMAKTIERAKKNGVAVSTVKNGTHFGYAAYYAMQALKENMIGLAFTSTGAAVAPFGGFEKMLGTNPICVAVPAGSHRPVVFDAATSNAAYNKVFFAHTEGRKIPNDWALDPNGLETTNPADVVDGGGALLPFGGYKGYGLGFVVFIITSLLAGMTFSDTAEQNAVDSYRKVAYNFAAIDISRFTDINSFRQNLDVSIEKLKGSKKREGTQEIFVPGEIEFNNYEKSERDGLVIYDGVAAMLRKTLQELGISQTLEGCVLKA